MEYKALYGEFPFLKEVGRERQEQFAEYFKSAPLWLMKELQMEELKKGTVFIREGEPADTVFFLSKVLQEPRTTVFMECPMILCSMIRFMPLEVWNSSWIMTVTGRRFGL